MNLGFKNKEVNENLIERDILDSQVELDFNIKQLTKIED